MEKLVIIGGGPAGLSAAIYASRAKLNPLVIEGIPSGGQLMLTTEVENYPGFAKGVLGPELIRQFRDQAKRFGTRLVQENVVGIEQGEDIGLGENRTNKTHRTYKIKTDKKNFQARSVLIATGADAIWMGLDSEQHLRGRGVSACATCDCFFFREKVVAVVGGGDSAMEEALTLTKFAKKVYIIHRRDAFRASKIMAERVLKHGKIQVIWNSVVLEVLGKEKVEGVRLENTPPGGLRSTPPGGVDVISLDGLFIAIGHKPATAFLQKSAIQLDKKGYIVTSQQQALEQVKLCKSERGCHCEESDVTSDDEAVSVFDFNFPSMTSAKGIFAAGDCVDHVYRQAATAVGMGVAAELEIEKYLAEEV